MNRRFILAEKFSPYLKTAFTLAEVLITLGIIGIIAAMTLPTVINHTRNLELQVRLKKTYAELNQISKLFLAEHGISVPEYINSHGDDYSAFINEFGNYLKNVNKASDWTWKSDPDEEGNVTLPYPVYSMNGQRLYDFACNAHYNGGIHSDILGRYISFDDMPVAGYNGPMICVDINGKNKPNTFGRDIFLFLFTTDGAVIPMGQKHKDNYLLAELGRKGAALEATPEYCRKDGGFWQPNAACSYYALLDQNPQGNGKYWKDFIGR